MKKRDFLKAGLVAGMSAGLSPVISSSAARAMGADSAQDTGFLFIHGSWHGAWCWTEVAQHLNKAGYQTFAIDLPGHGLDMVLPESFASRPLDEAEFANEPSAIASYDNDDYAAAIIQAAQNAKAAGVQALIGVGHSMGGVPLTFAASKRPDLFSGLVYLAAIFPTKGKAAGAYLGLIDQFENSHLNGVLLADPDVVGALRIDPRSEDWAYQNALKDALAADVDDKLLGAVMHLLTPDAPVSIYADIAPLTDAYGALPKRYIRAIYDKTLLPSTADALVKDLNQNWPDEPCHLIDIASSHEVMFAQPRLLADLLKEQALS